MSLNKSYQQDSLALVKDIKKGKKVAVRFWFKHYYGQLLAIAIKKAQNKEDAQELVQETFINCLRNIQSFKNKAKLSTWMKSILFHEIADYYRKLYAKKAIRTIPLAEFLLNRPIADSHQTSQQVQAVLSKMLSYKKELLLLKYVDKKKVKEIAKKMGKTVKAIESELFRARKEFKRLYALEFG